MADATITGSLLDAIGDAYDFRGAKIWLIFNTANKRVTAADGTVRTGAGAATVNADGTFSLAGVPVPSAGSNPVSFQVMVCYEVPPRLPYQRKVTRERGNFGWMTVTTSADIKDLEAEQYAPPEYLTVLTEQLDEKIAEAEEERQGAEDARDLAEQYRDEAHDISNIDTSDDVVEVLIKPGAAGPKTKAALTASTEDKVSTDIVDPTTDIGGAAADAIADSVQIITSRIAANGTNQTATLQAEIDALGANGGVILIPAGTYVFTGTIALPARVKLIGIGRAGAPVVSNGGGTVLSHEPTTAIKFIDTPAGSSYCQNIGLANLIIKGNTNSTVGLNLNNPMHSTFAELRVSGFDKNIVVMGAMMTKFVDVRSQGARTSCLHMTGLISTTTRFTECYFGQTSGVAACRPVVIDKGCALGITFTGGGAETSELGLSLGAGNVIDFDAFYTENIPATPAGVAVFEIGKTGAPAVSTDAGTFTFRGGPLSGTNGGVHASSILFDVDYCHGLSVVGARLARVADTVISTANSKGLTVVGCPHVQVTRDASVNTSVKTIGCTVGGVRVLDSYAGAITVTATLDFPSMAAGAAASLTITVPGAVVGDAVILGPPAGLEAGLFAQGRVSAANTVIIRMFNFSGATFDPVSATWRATVVRAPSQ